MLDVRRSPELQAALLALKGADRQLKRDINKDARTTLAPVWTQALTSQARTRADRAVIAAGPRVTPGDRRVRVQAATKRRPLSGGLIPADQYAGFEWGASPKKKRVQARSRKGRAYSYERTQNRQFRARSKEGHVAMRAAGDIGPALVSSWLRVVVGQFAAAFEVRR